MILILRYKYNLFLTFLFLTQKGFLPKILSMYLFANKIQKELAPYFCASESTLALKDMGRVTRSPEQRPPPPQYTQTILKSYDWEWNVYEHQDHFFNRCWIQKKYDLLSTVLFWRFYNKFITCWNIFILLTYMYDIYYMWYLHEFPYVKNAIYRK